MLPKEIERLVAGKNPLVRVFKSGAATQAFIAQELMAQGERVVWVVPGDRELAEARALLALLQGGLEKWAFLSGYQPGPPTAKDWAPRWAALHALAGGDARGLVLAVDNLLPKWPGPDLAMGASLTLARGEDMSVELLAEQAVAWGYGRESMVAAPGEFSVRGDVVDIFAPGYEAPLRLEFFGDTLESVRLFDSATQRSKAELDEATLAPVAPLGPALATPDDLQAAIAHIEHLKTTGQISSRTRDKLLEGLAEGDGFQHPGLVLPQPAHLSAYLPSQAVFLLSGASQLRSRLEEARWAWQEHLEARAAESGDRVLDDGLLLWPEAEARAAWTRHRQVHFEDLVMGVDKDGIELPETKVTQFTDLFWKPEERQRPFSALIKALKDWSGPQRKGQTILSFVSKRSRGRFLDLAEKDGLSLHTELAPGEPGVYALVSPLKGGMELAWRNSRILSEHVLQPPKAGAQVDRKQAFAGLKSYDDLEVGELLVHRDYGLGRFGGLNRMAVGDVAGDYLLLLFDGEDKLFLPVDRMKVVQRYKGPEGAEPRLDSLRGGRWKATKERARKAVEKIAKDLVEMYAYRRIAKGYAYGQAGELFTEFEAGFGFEETPDQAKAIQDVLQDMEAPEPMDRLVCGDVGFGKTEVAMRAAFRAVADGKQVAILCPTTVLAEQHYINFKSRMQGFAVTVGMLSRFVPKPKQKTVVEAAARGQVDILIGTHRLLSKDVKLPNLGLMVLDEEQRFGVKHKEKLKELKKNVDALTLTATPIPRTLQLSMSGIRSLSVMETAPADRKPVESALVEKDKSMLAGVLAREMDRGGQVFWVHNRVQTLDAAAEYVKELAPGARISVAHGQMSEKALEEAIHNFWHRETDVLVCTAIIESGLDFPNANTMVVDQAHMFGLGQLYQLRGRVGRSDRQAYAYFVVPNLDKLTDIARKRLKVILNMDYLGAGFQVAMEDLRLRGAGNILGEAQSGQIARVGLDLYLEMLEEEVARLKGEGKTEAVEAEVNFSFPAYIPETYVPDPGERLKYYRALSTAENIQAQEDVAAELRDRFGQLPPEAETFLAVLSLKHVLTPLEVRRADLAPGRAVLHFADAPELVTPERLLPWLATRQDKVRLSPPAKLEFRLGENGSMPQRLDGLRAELAGLLAELRGEEVAA